MSIMTLMNNYGSWMGTLYTTTPLQYTFSPNTPLHTWISEWNDAIGIMGGKDPSYTKKSYLHVHGRLLTQWWGHTPGHRCGWWGIGVDGAPGHGWGIIALGASGCRWCVHRLERWGIQDKGFFIPGNFLHTAKVILTPSPTHMNSRVLYIKQGQIWQNALGSSTAK